MAEYNVKTGPLDEAGEDLSVLAGEFGRYREGLDSVLANLPEGMSGMRRHLTAAKDSLFEISKQTRDTGKVLYGIADHYTRAERSAMGGLHRGMNINPAGQQTTTMPKIRGSSGVVLFDRTVMPDWLQMAVLEYEQTQRL